MKHTSGRGSIIGPSVAAMSPWRYIQSGHVLAGSGSSASASFSVPVASGHVVCGVCFANNTLTITSLTDDKSNSYTQIAGGSGSVALLPFWGGPFSNGPTTITIGLSGVSSSEWILIDEFAPSYVNIASDGSNLVNSASAQTSSGNFTTTRNGDLIYSVVLDSASMTAGSGFTFIQGQNGNDFCSEYLVQPLAGTTAGTWVGAAGSTAISAFALSTH